MQRRFTTMLKEFIIRIKDLISILSSKNVSVGISQKHQNAKTLNNPLPPLMPSFLNLRGCLRYFGTCLKNTKIKIVFCFLVSVLFIISVFRNHILYYCLKFKLPGNTRIDIMEYLSKSEIGVDLAINDLSNTSSVSRGGAFFILLWSNDKNTIKKLDQIITSDVSESNVIKNIEILCILVEKTSGSKKYMHKLYQLVKKADKYDNIPYWNYEIYYGRSCFLKYSNKYLTDKEILNLLDWPRNKDFPEEIDERFK